MVAAFVFKLNKSPVAISGTTLAPDVRCQFQKSAGAVVDPGSSWSLEELQVLQHRV